MALGRDRILVTGAGGFIGRHTVPALLDAGLKVRLCVRSTTSCPPAWQRDPRIDLRRVGDLATDELRPMLANIGAVVHLAGLAAGPSTAEALFEAANVRTTEKLAGAAREAEVETFVYLSSIMATTPNGAARIIDDATAPQPATAYGRSKRRAERAVRAIARPGSFVISLRPPLVIGGDARGNWRRLQAVASSGLPLPFASVSGRRSLMPVDFLAAIIARLCRMPPQADLSGEYCVAATAPAALPEMIRQLRAGMGLPPRLFRCPPELLRALGAVLGLRRQLASLSAPLHVDPSRFFSTFGIAEEVGVGEAIRRSGAAYRALREGQAAEAAGS